ncbi:3-oxoacid CoA-transferase [Massilia sp. DWR3-1-1]|uniref:3-oxoacid CoA-transferase n=1 Tax=Massilia sp. DWR3-1-1 TaxID=2804559 RepID=UPI003CF13B76
MTKIFTSAEAAVADIPDGASVAIAGFGVGHSYPNSLVIALKEQGARRLCLVANSLGAGEYRPELLLENGQVSKAILSFSARPGLPSLVEERAAAGELALEMVPQGILVERLRAAGAGLPAFYSPVTVGTPLAKNKEVRQFDGKQYVLEHALAVDYALIRGFRADTQGNVEFRGSSMHFHPSFAKGARVAIVEVEEIVEAGAIAPERVGLPGIFVARVVLSTKKVAVPKGAMRRRAPDTRREYFGKPALSRMELAERAAALLPENACVNLGSGLPTLVASHVAGRNITLHAENGALGYELLSESGTPDPDLFDAAGGFIEMRPGGALFDSVVSFEVARSGKLAAVLLGAYQVAQNGDLANWSVPGQVGGGIGGAMDLIAGASRLIIVMEHSDSKGRAKLVRECSYPLTAPRCVDVIVTDLALLVRRGEQFVIEEVAPGFSVDEVRALTGMDLLAAEQVGSMRPGAGSSVC